MDAAYLHLHSLLLASNAVLSSWSLVVICTLHTRPPACLSGISYDVDQLAHLEYIFENVAIGSVNFCY